MFVALTPATAASAVSWAAFAPPLAAFEIAPTDERCVEDVERAARATSGWEAVVGVYNNAIAAAEAALALGLVVLLFRRKRTLDSEAWSEMKG